VAAAGLTLKTVIKDNIASEKGVSMHRTGFSLRVFILGIFLFGPALAHATFINGGFETGNFTGWSTIGDALVVNGSFGTSPASGSYHALITNAPANIEFGSHPASYSGTNSVSTFSIPTFQSELEIFFDLPPVSFIGLAQALGLSFAFEGSAIKQSFGANAGSILTFKWNHLTDEGEPFDFAFIVLDGALSLLADFSTVNPGSSTPFLNESGYHTFATTLTTSGNHFIGIGVVDAGLPGVNSGVLVDNFSVLKAPEPASLVLIALGLIAMVGLKRRG
jgi:PEP-CTERM motif